MSENGHLDLKNLPFVKGQEVEITIVSKASETAKLLNTSLRDIPVTLIDPFEPVLTADDWRAHSDSD